MLLGMLSAVPSVKAAPAATPTAVVRAHEPGVVSWNHWLLSQQEALCVNAMNGWGAGLLLSGPIPRSLVGYESAWREAAILAAGTAPRTQVGELLGCFRVRLLRDTLSPNAP